MNYLRASILLIIFVIFVACMNEVHVEATRILPEDFSESNNLITFPVISQKAKDTMSYWLQRLASGPSPKGPGH
ncbi:hypothetical protein CDL12_00341 [Handroanthus impetiginosus]|uniref:Uncharacterized protein n=1 Tax=Handroanthus impetiginosus TaxID=429701 RepID=A0A2G9H6N1_9LAMI|nr:hypothetical protein CDL12_14246 [Handroanthus impetiginosus]PIN26900.1 hypothetical protein CDL12_00341 [Handroanthus impetiginosus]